jgi:Zn-dependent protease
MRGSLKIGRFAGIDTYVHWTFAILLGWAAWASYDGAGSGLAVALGTVFLLAVFGSVLLHELGHAVVARKLGVHVAGIELSFFGGAAKMVQLPRTATHELLIAAAGPAVSLILGGAGLGLGALTHFSLLSWLGWTNLIIAGFNLIPALPMDGGRILRAALTRRMDFVSATDVAVSVARVVAIAFAIIGLTGPFQLLLLAPYLWLMGTQEKMLARMMADRYVNTSDGYRERRYGDVEVLPRAYQPSMRRFTIRQRGGRLVIEEL